MSSPGRRRRRDGSSSSTRTRTPTGTASSHGPAVSLEVPATPPSFLPPFAAAAPLVHAPGDSPGARAAATPAPLHPWKTWYAYVQRIQGPGGNGRPFFSPACAAETALVESGHASVSKHNPAVALAKVSEILQRIMSPPDSALAGVLDQLLTDVMRSLYADFDPVLWRNTRRNSRGAHRDVVRFSLPYSMAVADMETHVRWLKEQLRGTMLKLDRMVRTTFV